MSEAFVITQGEYSDYHIVAVFDNKEAAEGYVAQSNAKLTYKYDDLYQLETFPLNSTIKSAVGPFITVSTAIGKDGDVQISPHYPEEPSGFHELVEEGPAEVGTHIWVSAYKPQFVSVRTIQAVENSMLARKVHREKVAQIRQAIIEGHFDWKTEGV